jgi:hypothetical protein
MTGLGGNCTFMQFFPPESKTVDEPWHGEALHEDRKGDDDEGGENDRVPLDHGRGNGKRKGQRECAAQPAPE